MGKADTWGSKYDHLQTYWANQEAPHISSRPKPKPGNRPSNLRPANATAQKPGNRPSNSRPANAAAQKPGTRPSNSQPAYAAQQKPGKRPNNSQPAYAPPKNKRPKLPDDYKQLKLKKFPQDRNSLFRALSYAIFGNDDVHLHIRQEVSQHILEHPTDVVDYINERTDDAFDHAFRMQLDGVPGTSTDIMAFCCSTLNRVSVCTKNKQGQLTWHHFTPANPLQAAPIMLHQEGQDKFSFIEAIIARPQSPAKPVPNKNRPPQPSAQTEDWKINEYIIVPAPEGFRNAIPVEADKHSLFGALCLAQEGNRMNYMKYRTAIAEAIGRNKAYYRNYLNLQPYRNIDAYIAELKKSKAGSYGDITVYCLENDCKVTVCRRDANNTWIWQVFPPGIDPMAPVTIHIRLHQMGTEADGAWNLIETNPPRFRLSSLPNPLKIIPWSGDAVLFDVRGDGNCLFRAISFALEGTEEYHHAYRILAFETIKKNPEFFGLRRGLNTYLKNHAPLGEYGGDTEISALQYAMQHDIFVFVEGHGWQPNPHNMTRTKGTIRLVFTGDLQKGHFQVYAPRNQIPQKHRHPRVWQFWNYIASNLLS